MADFGARFGEACRAVIRIVISAIYSASYLKLTVIFVGFCAVQAAIMYVLYKVRKVLHGKYESVWLRRVFSLIRWIILTPAWFLATLGTLYGLGASLSTAVVMTGFGFLVYGVICLENMKWNNW